MKAIIAVLALSMGVAHAAGISSGNASWKERNLGSAPISSKMPTVERHGAPTTASSYEMGQCAASIVVTQPMTAKRILDEAIARGERAEFYRGAEDLVATVNKDPVVAWTKGERACSGHLLAAIKFQKVDSDAGQQKR